MRRILLSSLPGVATTSIKIDGVLHEFSTVQGVKEDVTELILNIKSLALTMEGEGPQTIYIDAKGPGVVTGADIKTDGNVEVINKDLHIATLDENGKLYRLLGLRKRGGAWRKEDRPNMFYSIYVNPKNGKCSLNKDSDFCVEVIPKRHVKDWWNTTQEERIAILNQSTAS